MAFGPLSVVHSPSFTLICFSGATPRLVWILGHSFIHWAARRAEARVGGRCLGFSSDVARIRWLGIRGLRWRQVFPEFFKLSQRAPDGVVLVVHAGGNDLGLLRSVDLLNFIKQDLARGFALFRNLTLVWSEIIRRPVWESFAAPKALERSRRKVNRGVSQFVGSLGGLVVRHRELEGDNRDVVRSDGVHLTDIGMDIFLVGIVEGIERALAAGGAQGRP